MSSITTARRDIHNEISDRGSRNQAALEGGALRGELGIQAQLIAMSEQGRELRAAGDEAGYQATRAEAYRIYEASQAALKATDQAIPPAADILSLAKERSDLAQRHDDWAGAAQLNRVRVNVARGARLHWSLGDLLIQSVNNPGQVYSVSNQGCTCPNGAAGKASCWHVALFDLLLDMSEEAAATADMAADQAAAAAERATMGRRLCTARSKLLEAA